MTTELIHTRTGDTLRCAEHGLPSGLYRVLTPAGAKLWRVSVQTYLYDAPARALLAFDAPPVAPGTPAGPDTRDTLARLWAGATLAFDAPPLSGGLSISQPESTSTFKADRDRWLYLSLDFPAGRVLSWQSQIEVHAGHAPAPQPTVSPELAQRTLALAQQAGLIDALRKMARATTDDELVNWAMAQGDLWPSICRLVEITEAQ